MKRLSLAAAVLLAAGAGAAHAAPCTIVHTTGNINFVTGAADAQCNDGDDLKMFIDGAADANTAGGSLGGNNNSVADSNIAITSTGSGFVASTDANGFANFKSVVDNVDAYEATPNPGTILPKTKPPTTFEGFDGSLFRGQLTDNPNTPGVHWDGDVSIVVNLSGMSAPVVFTFTGFKKDKDIGVIGFDETQDPGAFVLSYFAVAGDATSTGAPIAAGLGSWDEFKQIEMSVPGASAAVPEPGAWAMLTIGFGLLAALGLRKRRENRFAL